MAKIQDKLVDVKGLRHIYEDLAGWISDVHSEFNDRVNNKLGAATNVPVPGQMLIADDNFSWTWKNMPAHISEADVRRIVNEQLAKIKGTVKDTFVHIDDAFPSTLLGIEIEGACRQDGTPSPDSPVPIEVIEHPVMQVRGRNFWDKGVIVYDYNNDYLKYNADASIKLEPGTYTISSDGRVPNLQFFEPDSHKQITCAEATDGAGADINYSVMWNGYCIASITDYSKVLSITITRPVEMTACVVNNYGTWIQIERGTEATAYEPYVGTSQSFTLPAEHPYLAKLPDGTADEIVVDNDGNISLVANVGHITLSELADESIIDCTDTYETSLAAASISSFRKNSSEKPIARAAISTFLPSGVRWNMTKIGVGWVDGIILHCPWDALGITADDSYNIKVNKFIEYAANKNDVHIYYALGNDTKKTYQLGKIEMPKAQDNIINVWTDAEVTPNTSIEYLRDMNIVVENLESAIASITQG